MIGTHRHAVIIDKPIVLVIVRLGVSSAALARRALAFLAAPCLFVLLPLHGVKSGGRGAGNIGRQGCKGARRDVARLAVRLVVAAARRARRAVRIVVVAILVAVLVVV
jgi:hypothetical protein